jgi:hypothetical protein
MYLSTWEPNTQQGIALEVLVEDVFSNEELPGTIPELMEYFDYAESSDKLLLWMLETLFNPLQIGDPDNNMVRFVLTKIAEDRELAASMTPSEPSEPSEPSQSEEGQLGGISIGGIGGMNYTQFEDTLFGSLKLEDGNYTAEYIAENFSELNGWAVVMQFSETIGELPGDAVRATEFLSISENETSFIFKSKTSLPLVSFSFIVNSDLTYEEPEQSDPGLGGAVVGAVMNKGELPEKALKGEIKFVYQNTKSGLNLRYVVDAGGSPFDPNAGGIAYTIKIPKTLNLSNTPANNYFDIAIDNEKDFSIFQGDSIDVKTNNALGKLVNEDAENHEVPYLLTATPGGTTGITVDPIVSFTSVSDPAKRVYVAFDPSLAEYIGVYQSTVYFDIQYKHPGLSQE